MNRNSNPSATCSFIIVAQQESYNLMGVPKHSGRILAGIEEGEGVVVQDLTIEGVAEWRQIATYLEDRKDHLDLYRKQLDL